MPKIAASSPLVRLALSPGVQNLAVLLEEDMQHQVLEIISILPDGRLLEMQRITHPIDQEISTLKWVSDEELLLIYGQGATLLLALYKLAQGRLERVLATTLIPARVLAASSENGSLEVLLAISTKNGIRFGLFFPQVNRYQMISGPWLRATFGAWQPKERLLGVNIALTASDEHLQGIIYQYGDAAEQTKVVHLHSLVGQQSVINAFGKDKTVWLTTSSDNGFLLPGSHSLETGETCWFKEIGFSAEALGSSDNGELILCGGLVEADWRYVVTKSDGTLGQNITVENALLLHPVFCQDSRYLLAQYQASGIAPTLCRYDRQTRVCEMVLHLPMQDYFAQIRAEHWWAKIPTLERLPVVSLLTPATDYERIVVFLHGGPHLNILKSYSPLLSRLVAQGFWVVAPNFPGSIGYGTTYEQMTRGDWGGIDVQSIIELAEMLRRQSSGRQISLYGVSYGGYLALLAAGLRPDLWNCVIAGAPVSDLQDLYTGANEHMQDLLRLELGALLENEAELAARSPSSYVQELSQLPVLLLHGADDTVCPIRQSRRLAEMLAHATEGSKNFEYCEFSDLKHQTYSERFWVETVIDFLTQHVK